MCLDLKANLGWDPSQRAVLHVVLVGCAGPVAPEIYIDVESLGGTSAVVVLK